MFVVPQGALPCIDTYFRSNMSGEDDDWRSDMLDDDGNYIQESSAYDLPEIVSRGTAPQRLNMQHGFMKHIVSRVAALPHSSFNQL